MLNLPDTDPPAPATTTAGHGKTTTSWLHTLGPGLITGAADDDPSGIATYSQAGAQFGFGMLWTVLLTFPLMAAIQIVQNDYALTLFEQQLCCHAADVTCSTSNQNHSRTP
jgi:hypothetical protein